MKRVKELSKEEKKTLQEIKKNHPKYRERERAYAILLSNKGYSPNQISDIFEISSRMVYTWIDEYNTKGFIGLMTQKGQGRKPNLKKREIRENSKRVSI